MHSRFTLRALIMFLLALALVVVSGCSDDDDDGGDGSGDSSGDSGTDGGNTDGGSTDGGSTDGGSCDQTDPSGQSCQEAENCSIACDCGSGMTVTIGACAFGSCGSSPSDCESACSESGGAYSNNYCFAGTTGSTDGSSDGSDGSTDGDDCAPLGGDCSFNSDCCSDTCNFDSVCE